MATIDSFLDDVMLDVPGALLPVARRAVLRTVQEFFRRTKIWKQDVTLTMSAGVTDYSLSSDAAIVPVEVIDSGRIKVSLTDEDMTDRYGPDWRQETGPVLAILQTSPEKVRVYPTPAATETLTLSVAVTAGDSATAIPDAFADRYREGITAGAIARLMLSPKKPYSDDAHGQIQSARFEQTVGQALEDRAKGFGRTRVRRSIHWF